MNLRTPLVASVAVLSALGGVAAAAIVLPSSPPRNAAAVTTASDADPVATPTVEVRTKTIRRTIHVVRKDKVEHSAQGRSSSSPAARVASTPAPAATTTRTFVRDDSRSGSDNESGDDRGRGDDSGHGSDDAAGDDHGRHGGDDD